MISLDTDRSIDIVVVDDDVGVSMCVDGFDACVLVLLSDDVEPPVDVDCRWRFDAVESMDERRLVGTVGFGRAFAVGGRRTGTRR